MKQHTAIIIVIKELVLSKRIYFQLRQNDGNNYFVKPSKINKQSEDTENR